MNKTVALLCVLVSGGLSSTASAHALHGSGTGFVAGFAHPFLGLDHVLAMVAIGICVVQLRSRTAWRMAAATAIAIITGALLAGSIAAVPAFETLVAASVCALGLLVACAGKIVPACAVALTAFFALIHGAAHGTEQPAEFSTMAYLAGALLASAALQALGAALGFAFRRNSRLAGLPLIAAGAWLVISP